MSNANSAADTESLDNVMTDSNAPTRDSSITDPSTADGFKKLKTMPHEPAMETTVQYGDFGFLADKILQPVDDEEILGVGSYTWNINEFRNFTDDKARSPVFNVAGWDFDILLFPKGNSNMNLALYLEPQPKKTTDEATGELVPVDPKWYVCAQFTLIISNPNDPQNCVVNTSQQRFCKTATDWGFSNFIELKAIYQKHGNDLAPLLQDDKMNITAFVKVLKDPTGVMWHNFMDYDSKKESGFVGFRNQGATCYLNSLLQSYFFTKCFRKAVYEIPTENEPPDNNVSLALQRIFYQLQRSEEALDTTELTKSFGWDHADAFTQHDVQEMNRILMDKLESKMKGTSVENMLNETFVGKMRSYIKCVNVKYESSRIEDFWDIQLNVKDLNNLHESFQNYTAVEMLEGENQYAAPDYGLQDAKKGVNFVELPDVLHLQLKRFEFDFTMDTPALIKLNDRYEFPESIDLSPFVETPEGTEAKPCIYDLHGVLVHQGDPSSGHYYAMIRPNKSDEWFRFDDERVWRVTKRQVFDENYGVDTIGPEYLSRMSKPQQHNYMVRRQTSAYMLVYMKRSEIDKLLEDVPDESVPKYITEKVDEELATRIQKRKEMEELHLYLNIKIFTDKLFKTYQGFGLGADQRVVQDGLYTEESFPSTIKALKTSKFKELYPEIKEKTGIDPANVTFWSMTYRCNQTLRPNNKLEDIGEMTVEEVYTKFFSKKFPILHVWLEESSNELFESLPADLKPIEKIDVDQDENLIESTKIILFLKFFDVETQSLKGISHFYANEDDSLESLVPAIKAALQISDVDELDFFEEISNGSIDRLNPLITLYKSELTNGDIITAQKAIPQSGDLLADKNVNNLIPFYTSVDQFYLYLGTRRHINIQPLSSRNRDDEFVEDPVDGESGASFDMWISSHARYSELVQRVAKKINKDPNYLRLYVNYSGHRTVMRSNSIIGSFIPKSLWQSMSILFEYESLNAPLSEVEQMTPIRVHWLPSGYCHYTDHEILVKSNSTVADLVDKLQSKIGFSDEDKKSVMMWSNIDSKFITLIPLDYDPTLLQAETEIFGAILPEETNVLTEEPEEDEESEENPDGTQTSNDKEPNAILTPVIQFNKDPRNLHGISFVFPLYAKEPLHETKIRMQKKMGLGQKEFAKVQICVWNIQRKAPKYFDRDDNIVLFDILKGPCYLCLDTPDRTSRTGGHHQGGGISIR